MLKLGSFAPCSKIYNGSEYIDATQDQIYKCCKTRCDKYHQRCKDLHVDCGEIPSVCNRVCQTARYNVGSKYFDNCMEKYKCLDNDFINHECLLINKDDIINCCTKSCDFEDCENYCKTSYDINLERSKPYILKSNHHMLYIGIFIVIITIIFIWRFNRT